MSSENLKVSEELSLGPSLVAQWVRPSLCDPSARAQARPLVRELDPVCCHCRFCIPYRRCKTMRATARTRHSQINA